MNLKKTSGAILKISAKMLLYLFLIILLYVVGTKGFEFGEKVFSNEGIEEEPGREVVVVVPSNATTTQVGNILIDQGLIDSNIFVFMTQAFLYEAKFYPGKYKLNTSDNVEMILTLLSVEPTTQEQTTEEASVNKKDKTVDEEETAQ